MGSTEVGKMQKPGCFVRPCLSLLDPLDLTFLIPIEVQGTQGTENLVTVVKTPGQSWTWILPKDPLSGDLRFGDALAGDISRGSNQSTWEANCHPLLYCCRYAMGNPLRRHVFKKIGKINPFPKMLVLKTI